VTACHDDGVATLLLELHGVVEADPDRVAEILLDARPGGRSPLAPEQGADVVAGSPQSFSGSPQSVTGSPQSFTVRRSGSRFTVTVDRAARSVAMHGEWWYRGETSVTPEPRGALVTHRVFDVAESRPWAVRFVSRGPLLAAPATFADHLRVLGEQLGCPAYPLD
jgi:hypothetical protein